MKLKTLSDQELLTNTENLAKQEREILIQVLWHLAEIQRRKLFSPSYQSLFDYAVRRLGYSEDQAARRIAAMRLLIELPEIETKVSSGALTLTTLGLAQTFFRHENQSRESKLETLNLLEEKSSREASRVLIEASSAPEKLRPESARPISPEISELRFPVKDETLNKIQRLKGLLAHKHPHIATGDLLELVCDIALAKLDPAKPHSRSVPIDADTTPLSSPTRTPTAALRRFVWKRANNQCEMCASNHQLEIDHIKPFALGGLTSSENLRLLCRNCNQRESIKIFGVRSNSHAHDAM